MAVDVKLNKPWLVAVWPGMGHVAMSAGYYLMAKLGMHLVAELASNELFDIEHVEVKDGIIHPGHRPRSRFFAWRDPAGKHDLLLFIGEAQPPIGKVAFCRRILEFAGKLGITRVFTFASMATQMHPQAPSKIYGAATDPEVLALLRQLELEVVENGQISGLNGVLLGVAAEEGLDGACLLGEMPQIFAQLPFPKAALAVLSVFTTIAGIELDTTELEAQAADVEQKLVELLSQVENAIEDREEEDIESIDAENDLDQDDSDARDRIEALFEQAGRDRSKAYELKQELDRLNLFREYEDRFLDLFKPER